MAEDAGVRLSTRSQLKGNVVKVTMGAVNAEVELSLDSGETIAAIVTNASVTNLGLAVGSAAVAAFKASGAIVGVRA